MYKTKIFFMSLCFSLAFGNSYGFNPDIEPPATDMFEGEPGYVAPYLPAAQTHNQPSSGTTQNPITGNGMTGGSNGTGR